jgi:hypothetical protein
MSPRKQLPKCKPRAIPSHRVLADQLCQNIVLSHHLLSDALRDMRNSIGKLRMEISELRMLVDDKRKRKLPIPHPSDPS